MFFVYMLIFMVVFIGIALIGAGIVSLFRRHGEDELRHQCDDMHCSTEPEHTERDEKFYNPTDAIIVYENWIRDNFRPALRRAERWARDHGRISATIEVSPPLILNGDNSKLGAMMNQAMNDYGYRVLNNYSSSDGLRITFSWV